MRLQLVVSATGLIVTLTSPWTVGQRGEGGRREIKTKAANSCVLVLFFFFLGGGLARYVLAELSVVSCVGGSSGQGRGNAEASSAASLLRHGALRVDPLH